MHENLEEIAESISSQRENNSSEDSAVDEVDVGTVPVVDDIEESTIPWEEDVTVPYEIEESETMVDLGRCTAELKRSI